jgi:hypothetical protein
MIESSNFVSWWELHLRKARGESLSGEEQNRYDAEIAKQDREAAPLTNDLESLRRMRCESEELASANARLVDRIADLTRQARAVERGLSEATRSALGVRV